MRIKNPAIYTPNKLHADVSMKISCPAEVVYNFWKDLSNLHLVMYHLKSIRILSDTNSEWIFRIPCGIGDIKWEAQIVKNDPGKYIEWTTLPDAKIEHHGFVQFNDHKKKQSTIRVSIHYQTLMDLGGSKISALTEKIFSEILANELKGLKSYLESSITHKQ